MPPVEADGDAEDASAAVALKPMPPPRKAVADAPRTPRKKKDLAKKKRKGSPVVLVCAIVGCLVCVCVGGVIIWLAVKGKGKADPENQVAKPEGAAPVGAFAVEKSAVIHVAFTADGKQIFSCTSDGGVSLWDAATGKQVNTLAIPSALCAAVAPDGRHAAVGHLRRGHQAPGPAKVAGGAGLPRP